MTTQKIDPHKTTQNNYKVIAKLYKEDFDEDYSDLPILVDEVIKYLKSNNLQGEILDIGCGTGILTRYLKQHKIANHITGIDFTHEFIEDYQKEFPDCNAVETDLVSFLESTKLTSCAGIFFNWSFFHIPEEETVTVLKRCYEILAQDGIIYMSLHQGTKIGLETDPYQTSKDPRLNTDQNIQCYMHYYIKDEIRNKLEKTEYRIVKLVTQKFDQANFGDFAVDKIYVFAKK